MTDNSTYRSLMPVFEELRGERVLLRPYREEDAAMLFEAVDESRAHLDAWVTVGLGHTTLEQTQDWINQKTARWILREEFACGIWDISGNCLLGDCVLRPHAWDVPSFSIGYWLRSSATGQGFMTEAVKLLVDFAFEGFKAKRVLIACDELNEASAAVPKRLGFELEARLRNDRRVDGTLRNTLIFAKIA